jgi:hypothetical protein
MAPNILLPSTSFPAALLLASNLAPYENDVPARAPVVWFNSRQTRILNRHTMSYSQWAFWSGDPVQTETIVSGGGPGIRSR